MENIINGSEFVILEKGVTIMDVVHQKIKEQMLRENTDAFSIADLGDLVHQHLRWQRALPQVKPFYAVKCNNSKPVAQILAQMGLGFDCASKNEIATILDIAVPAERIIYANPCKEVSHIKYAVSRGVQMMTFDNKDELLKVAMIHPTAKMVLRIAVNDFTSHSPLSEKFGASLSECRLLMEYAKALNLDIIGVSFHVGSGCTDPKIFAQAIADARVVFDIGIHLGFQMYLLDIGGGFPGTGEDKVTFEEVAAEINPALDIYFPDKTEVQIIAEPGRYYVTSSFTLVVNIIARKTIENSQASSNDEEAGNEKTMMYYLNDGLYGSFNNFAKYRELLKPTLYEKHSLDQKLYNTRIWGPTCDAWDHISDTWKLPELEIGDWLLFKNNGAYTISTSTMFNGFHAVPTHYAISEEAWETLQNIKREIQSPVEEQDGVDPQHLVVRQYDLAIEEAQQQLQPFCELSEDKCQQLFKYYCEFLYHEDVITLLENVLDNLSSEEHPNLIGLQELEATEAQNVKDMLHILGYTCPNEDDSSENKDAARSELFTAAFYLFSALDALSEESLAVLGICCEIQILPTLLYLINNIPDDGMLPADNPDLLLLKEEDHFYVTQRLFALSNICLEKKESFIHVVTGNQPGMLPVCLCIVLQGFAILSGIRRDA